MRCIRCVHCSVEMNVLYPEKSKIVNTVGDYNLYSSLEQITIHNNHYVLFECPNCGYCELRREIVDEKGE